MSSNQPSSSSSSARPPSATGAGRSGSSGQQHFGHPPHPPPPQGYEYRYEYPPPPQGYVYQTGPPPLARPGLQPPGSYGGPHPAGYAPPPGSPMPAAPYPPPAAVVQAASSDKSKKHSHSQSHAHSHHSHSHSQSRRSQSGPSSSDHRPAGDRISASSSTAANAGHVGAKEQSQEGKAFKVLEETTEATSPTIRFTGTVPTSPLTTRQSPLTSAQRRTKKAGKSKHRSRRTDGAAAAAAGEGAAALAATAASASAPGVVVAGSPQQQGQQSSPSPAGASPAALMAMAATASAGSVARNNDGLGAKGGAQMGAGTTGKERGADETTAVIAAGGDIATVGSDKYSSLLSRYAAQSERLQQIRAAQQAREQQQQQQGWLEREVAKTAATLRQQQMSQQMSQQVALGSLFSLEQARIRRAQQLAQVAALQSGAAAAAFAAAGMVPGIAQQTLTNAAAAPSTVAGGIAGSVARGGATVAKADTTTARDAAPKENVAKGTANERDVAGILGSLATVDASKKRSREDSVDVNEKNKTKKSRKETHTSREKEITVALDSDSDDGVVQTLDDDDDDFDDEHKVLQTPLAGPYVRGFLNKDSWTVAEIKEQSGMGKGYFKNQIVRIGTFGTSNEGTFSLTAANINSITARLDEDIRKVVSRSVGVAEEEMRRNHSAIVSNMETRCKRLEKELDAEKLKVRNVTVASRKSSNNPDDHIKEMDRAKQRLKEAEEGYKTALSAQKVEHGDMLAKAKEENDKKLEKLMEDEKKKARSLKEKINALQAELEETKTNHARSLKMYLEASSNALRLVRKDERRGLL